MEVSKLTQQSTSLLYNLNYVSSTRNICQYFYKKRHPVQEYFIRFCAAAAAVVVAAGGGVFLGEVVVPFLPV